MYLLPKQMDINLIDMNYGKSYSYDNDTKIVDEIYRLTTLHKDDYPYIYIDHDITEDEINVALNTIITYFMQHKTERMLINLDDRNEKLAPVKEMSVEEIEKILGYKVKVVNKEKESN